MRLLVKRDRNLLVPCEGKAYMETETPDFLNVPRVIQSEDVTRIENRSPDDDLLIANSEDYESIGNHLSSIESQKRTFLEKVLNKPEKPPVIHGIWSGYRSALVQGEDGKLYKVKGVSLNPQNPEITKFEDGVFWIQGGQKKSNAEWEREFSNRFRRVLEDNGMQPPMQYRGMWKYLNPVRKERPVASIYEVEGDTRLDELMFVLDTITEYKAQYTGRHLTSTGEALLDGLEHFYYDVGYVVGRLKRLMDKSGQTWSSTSERTNAHIGNVVLWNGKDTVKVGLVDFDASMNLDELSESQMRDIQAKELENIAWSVDRLQSARQIGGVLSEGKLYHNPELRKEFVSGLREGYESTQKDYSNEVSLEALHKIFSLVRSDGLFETPKSRITTPSIIESGLKSKIDLEDIIKRNYYFDNYNKKDLDDILKRDYYNDNLYSKKKNDFYLSYKL